MAAPKVQARVPRGMRDILPPQMIKRQFVMDTMREVFESFGFEPLQTPVLELKETLVGKYGPDAEKLIYYAQHSQGSEELAMRYDLTVPLCRVSAMYPDLTRPFKRYQMAPVWRAERPQKGRYREFYQCDVDVVGSKSMLADAEVINVLYQVLKRLGFQQFRTLLNNRKILKGLGQYLGIPAEQAGALYRSIDKLDKIGIAGVREELEAGGMSGEAISRLLDILQIRGSNSEMIAALRERLIDYPQALEGLDELAEIVAYLRALGIPEENVQVSFAMVRGLDYYTGPIYETVVDEPKIGSITGGGRYDELIGLFTNQSFPTTGTSLGIERIIDVMDELNMFPPSIRPTVTEVLVTIFDTQNAGAALALASELRAAGIKTELYFEAEPLGKQIKYAVKKGIPYLAILGPDELAAGKVALRDLAQGKQETVARAELTSLLRGRYNR